MPCAGTIRPTPRHDIHPALPERSCPSCGNGHHESLSGGDSRDDPYPEFGGAGDRMLLGATAFLIFRHRVFEPHLALACQSVVRRHRHKLDWGVNRGGACGE
jgi:hypothetical protein